jgi:hypothetical protein
MIFTASGRFESAKVVPVVENVEVAAAAGGNGGDSDGNMSIPSLVAPVVVPGHGDLDILLVILYRRVKVPSVRSILYSTT